LNSILIVCRDFQTIIDKYKAGNWCEKSELYNIKLLGWINHLVSYNAASKISLAT